MGNPVRRAAARAAALVLVEVALFLALSLGLTGTTGTSWDLAFVVGLSLAVAPVFLFEESSARGKLAEGALAAVVGAWAGLAFLFVFFQITYSASFFAHQDVPRALVSGEALVTRLWRLASQTRALLLAWAPAFALGFFLARQRVNRWVQAPAILFATLVVARLGVIGFQGLPQVGWLVTSSWTSPWLGTWVVLQPWLLAASLPLLSWLAERRWPREASGAEEDLQNPRLVGAGEGSQSLLEGELPVDQGAE